ncbi:MAG: energy-coupling factor transporter transmembrane component T [Anaerolineales bacterium]
MHERLSFYVKRESALHQLNPLTKLTLIFGLILPAFLVPYYWTPHLLLVLVVFPLAFLGKVQREYFNASARLILPVCGFLFVMQALFIPGGEKVLAKVWFLTLTQESLLFAFANAIRIMVMVSSFTLFMLTTHPSELMSDLTQRGLPGQFAYVIIATLQIIPQMQAKANTIIAAQRSRGLDTESSFSRRIRALVPLVGPLVFGSLVEVEERAIAIEARGFTSRRPKSSLREILDRPLDKGLRWFLLLVMLASVVSRIWFS